MGLLLGLKISKDQNKFINKLLENKLLQLGLLKML